MSYANKWKEEKEENELLWKKFLKIRKLVKKGLLYNGVHYKLLKKIEDIIERKEA